MPSKTFQIPNMLGGEDLTRVENILRQTNGVQDVNMHPATKEVTVAWNDRASWDEILRNLTDMGYMPEDRQ